VGTLAGGSRPSPALAETNGVPLSSHLAPELSAHLLAATPAAHWLEYHDWLRPILQEPIAVWDGRAMPSAVPGAGLSWDEEAIRRFLFS
jgi:mandelate racemase